MVFIFNAGGNTAPGIGGSIQPQAAVGSPQNPISPPTAAKSAQTASQPTATTQAGTIAQLPSLTKSVSLSSSIFNDEIPGSSTVTQPKTLSSVPTPPTNNPEGTYYQYDPASQIYRLMGANLPIDQNAITAGYKPIQPGSITSEEANAQQQAFNHASVAANQATIARTTPGIDYATFGNNANIGLNGNQYTLNENIKGVNYTFSGTLPETVVFSDTLSKNAAVDAAYQALNAGYPYETQGLGRNQALQSVNINTDTNELTATPFNLASSNVLSETPQLPNLQAALSNFRPQNLSFSTSVTPETSFLSTYNLQPQRLQVQTNQTSGPQLLRFQSVPSLASDQTISKLQNDTISNPNNQLLLPLNSYSQLINPYLSGYQSFLNNQSGFALNTPLLGQNVSGINPKGLLYGAATIPEIILQTPQSLYNLATNPLGSLESELQFGRANPAQFIGSLGAGALLGEGIGEVAGRLSPIEVGSSINPEIPATQLSLKVPSAAQSLINLIKNQPVQTANLQDVYSALAREGQLTPQGVSEALLSNPELQIKNTLPTNLYGNRVPLAYLGQTPEGFRIGLGQGGFGTNLYENPLARNLAEDIKPVFRTPTDVNTYLNALRQYGSPVEAENFQLIRDLAYTFKNANLQPLEQLNLVLKGKPLESQVISDFLTNTPEGRSAFVYGSAAQKAAFPEAREAADVDVLIKTPQQARQFATDLTERLNSALGEARYTLEGSKIIDSQTEGHILDTHTPDEITNPVGYGSTANRLGLAETNRPLQIEGAQFIQPSEQTIRKAAELATPRIVNTEIINQLIRSRPELTQQYSGFLNYLNQLGEGNPFTFSALYRAKAVLDTLNGFKLLSDRLYRGVANDAIDRLAQIQLQRGTISPEEYRNFLSSTPSDLEKAITPEILAGTQDLINSYSAAPESSVPSSPLPIEPSSLNTYALPSSVASPSIITSPNFSPNFSISPSSLLPGPYNQPSVAQSPNFPSYTYTIPPPPRYVNYTIPPPYRPGYIPPSIPSNYFSPPPPSNVYYNIPGPKKKQLKNLFAPVAKNPDQLRLEDQYYESVPYSSTQYGISPGLLLFPSLQNIATRPSTQNALLGIGVRGFLNSKGVPVTTEQLNEAYA